jgi:N-acetylmuramoyl-L-alanine amidase
LTGSWQGSALAGDRIASPNVEPRAGARQPDMLILHYTGMMSSERAVDWLCRPESKVSCHYLIDEHGGIVQMVDERLRAWHAGQSSWHGETDTNSCSIGIEIHNPGYDRGYADFPDVQMDAVEALCVDIVRRHAIAPARVLGHSDVAPFRKIDPGHKFDWRRLAQHGVGVWVRPEPIVEGIDEADARLKPGMTGPAVEHLQQHLIAANFDGIADRSTRVTLERLLHHLSR